MACLTTEVIDKVTPDSIYDLLQTCDEDEVAGWVENLLLIGRAFQLALDTGRLDDL